jgi:hypothetical protein
VSLGVPPGVFAQTDPAQHPSQTSKRFRGEPVTLNFVNADIEGVTRAMGAILKQQFIVDPRVRGNITVYSDQYAQPFLNAATRLEDVEQRMPSVLDGYHWRTDTHSRTEPGAGGFFISNGTRLVKTGKVVVKETGKRMTVFVPVQDEMVLRIQFDEKQVSVTLQSTSSDRILPLDLAFEWDVTKSSMTRVMLHQVDFKADAFDYSIGIRGGIANDTPKGWTVSSDGGFVLELAQRR